MANQTFNSPNVPGVTDRVILVPYVRSPQSGSQPVALANAGRTYWCFENLSVNTTMSVSINTARGNGPGSHPVLPGKGLDSSVVPELTQGALFICGNQAGAEFTFEEVAVVQSAQQ